MTAMLGLPYCWKVCSETMCGGASSQRRGLVSQPDTDRARLYNDMTCPLQQVAVLFGYLQHTGIASW